MGQRPGLTACAPLARVLGMAPVVSDVTRRGARAHVRGEYVVRRTAQGRG